MGKSSQLFMQMREEELLGLEHIDDEYTYKQWINNLKSPKTIGIGKDQDEFVCYISGDSPKEIYDLAKEHNIKDLEIIIPEKHIFKN
jgi:hypothetical protein